MPAPPPPSASQIARHETALRMRAERAHREAGMDETDLRRERLRLLHTGVSVAIVTSARAGDRDATAGAEGKKPPREAPDTASEISPPPTTRAPAREAWIRRDGQVFLRRSARGAR